MDKAIQLVVVAMVAIIAALVLAFLLQDQTGSFSDFLNTQRGDASCSNAKTQYENGIINADEFQDRTEDLDIECERPPDPDSEDSG